MADFAPKKPASMANTLEKLKILSVASWWFAGFYVIFDVSPLMIRKEF